VTSAKIFLVSLTIFCHHQKVALIKRQCRVVIIFFEGESPIMPYSRSFVRRTSVFIMMTMMSTLLSACGGTSNEMDDWWYNQAYEAPAS
jgi:hypothetical protein